MPIGVGAGTWNTGRVRQRAASSWFVITTWPHRRPGMFQAFEADITVTVWAAVASETDA